MKTVVLNHPVNSDKSALSPESLYWTLNKSGTRITGLKILI